MPDGRRGGDVTAIPSGPPGPRSETPVRVPLRSVLADGRWALEFTWRTARAPAALLVASELVKALVPAGLTVAFGGLVDAASAAVAGGAGADPRRVLWWIGAALGLSIVGGLSKIAERHAGRRLLDELEVSLTGDLLEHAASLDVATFEDPASLDLLERARRDPATSFHMFLLNALHVLGDGLQGLALAGVLVAVEPWLLLPLVVLSVPYGLFQWRTASRRYGQETRYTTRRRWSQYFVQLLTRAPGVTEIKLLDLGPLLLERFRGVASQFRDESTRLLWRSSLVGAAFVVLSSAALFSVLAHLGFRVLAGGATVGSLVVFAGAAARLRAVVEETLAYLGSALERALFVRNLRAFLALAPRQQAGGGRPLVVEGAAEVELEGVTFTYPGAGTPALRDVSLRVRPGETVALVGENGAGKTTLVRLVARIYDADSGTVRFGGTDVRELDAADLRRNVAWVMQDFLRFEATAEENVAFGDWRRLLGNRREVEEVARLAGVAPLVESLPGGWDTWLGNMFGRQELSSGQWQRLAIARALARKAPLLVLDEPTASLDVRAEEELFRRFREMAAGRTAILVSHRFSTVAIADRVVVLSEGRIAESGSHAELLRRGGIYAELWRLSERMR
ncbi:MAG: ABC transporter ATP-binding protein [Thermoanaerobaculia bacterium]